MSRSVRVALTLARHGALAYLLWKIDLGRRSTCSRAPTRCYFLLALAIMLVTILPMAWRWQLLLAREGIVEDRFPG